MSKLRILSLFSGIGAFEKALENLEIEHELVNYCEIDKYASKSYSLIHSVSEDLNLRDITNIDITKLPKNIDLVTHGSPCFPRGTKVLTEKGYKCIEDVVLGDKVLTHTNQYKEVYELFKNKSSDIYEMKTRCSFNFKATGNHPFYVREKYRLGVYEKSERCYDIEGIAPTITCDGAEKIFY